MAKTNIEILKEKEFTYNNIKYLVRNCKSNSKKYFEIVDKEFQKRPQEHMKPIARGFLKQNYDIEVPVSDRYTTPDAIKALIELLDCKDDKNLKDSLVEEIKSKIKQKERLNLQEKTK